MDHCSEVRSIPHANYQKMIQRYLVTAWQKAWFTQPYINMRLAEFLRGLHSGWPLKMKQNLLPFFGHSTSQMKCVRVVAHLYLEASSAIMPRWLRLVSMVTASCMVLSMRIVVAFLAYELFLTFDEAVQFVQSRKHTAILMFLTNQCVILALSIINILGMLPLTSNMVR